MAAEERAKNPLDAPGDDTEDEATPLYEAAAAYLAEHGAEPEDRENFEVVADDLGPFYGAGTQNMDSKTITLITSKCGAARFLCIKWP